MWYYRVRVGAANYNNKNKNSQKPKKTKCSLLAPGQNLQRSFTTPTTSDDRPESKRKQTTIVSVCSK
jgi:hypothetical protein